MEGDNRNKVNDAAHDAYAAIEECVKMLLKIDRGDKVLPKDAPITNQLTATVSKFEYLSMASDNNMTAYGLTAGDSMAFGDKSSSFETKLTERMDLLNGSLEAIYEHAKPSERDSAHGGMVSLRHRSLESSTS